MNEMCDYVWNKKRQLVGDIRQTLILHKDDYNAVQTESLSHRETCIYCFVNVMWLPIELVYWIWLQFY